MALVIGATLAFLSLAVAVLPFLRRKFAPLQGMDVTLELEKRREAVYQEVRTLHSDYVLGDVPQAEYEERLQAHRLMAAALLRQQERLHELDQRLEEEIRRIRNGALFSSDGAHCPECGTQVDVKADQCPSCGTMLSGAARDEG